MSPDDVYPVTVCNVPVFAVRSPAVWRSLPLHREGGCAGCEFRLLCQQLEQDGQPLVCEWPLRLEVKP